MKIVTQYFESIAGVEIYPIISLLVFFLFFVAVTAYVIGLDKKLVNEMANFPLGDDVDASTTSLNEPSNN